jgi:hypothetical protein
MGSDADIVVQLAHEGDTVAGGVSYAANGFRALTGVRAFNRYMWMTDTRTVNASGTFRGMVVSTRWATAYHVISPVANAVGNISTVASIAANALDLAPQFEAIRQSADGPATKSLRYASLAGTVAQRTLAGIITSGVHLIYMPLIFGCGAIAKSTGGTRVGSAATVCSNVVKQADALVTTSATYVTDPTNQQEWLQTVTIVIR